jgi:hypothetical protein
MARLFRETLVRHIFGADFLELFGRRDRNGVIGGRGMGTLVSCSRLGKHQHRQPRRYQRYARCGGTEESSSRRGPLAVAGKRLAESSRRWDVYMKPWSHH